MKKFANITFTGILAAMIASSSAFAADTTWSSAKQPKAKKIKPPVNLYVPTAAEMTPQYGQGFPNSQYGAKFNIGSGSQPQQQAQWNQQYIESTDDNGADVYNSPYDKPYSAPQNYSEEY